jgi:hypothetical protein
MKYFVVASKWFVVAALSLTMGASAARADVVAPPEGGVCPLGTQPNASHGVDPAICYVINCNTDSECTSGNVCREQQLCTNGSWAAKSCADGSACPAGWNWPCIAVKVCIPGGITEPPPKEENTGSQEEGSCACRHAGSGPVGPGALVMGIGCVVLAMRRRRAGF